MSLEKMFSESKERSRIETIYWAGVLIWAGLVFIVSSSGFLPTIGNADAWTYIIFGAGLYGTLMNVYYVSSPDTLNPRTWDWTWSGFWLIVGLGGFFTIDLFWPVVLVLFGITVLVKGFRNS
jgi:hypothetical protein